MRGGNRFGAGRPAYKRKTTSCCRLDIPKMAGDGFLRPGRRFPWVWSADGRECASVYVVVAESQILLQYSHQGTSVSFPIDLTRSSCNYGGSRLWACCPQCRHRVGTLYLTGSAWACRKCARLSYPSQSDDETGRAWRAQYKIEARLAGGKGEWNGWRKPKGMHKRTFDRLRYKIILLEEVRDRALCHFASRYFNFIGDRA